MSDSSEPVSGAVERETPPITERQVDKIDVIVQRLGALAQQHKSQELLDIQYRLWMLVRYLRHDEDLSQDDLDL